ncbi:hypothetical protein [uncultured Microbacterium sp.]|uniref:hypothetical protein n=1 Tax=uncultured Microbacterium sp. TaxID=191216 RepID=UPI0028E36C92|nr:hypothetical protein [uncultured Microbacterium sp.]
MSKHTAASVEKTLPKAQSGYKQRANAVKAAHDITRQAIKADQMTSDLAKKDKLEALDKETRSKLDAIKDEQTTFEKGLRDTIERELRGNQPADANSVLLRRDAADRVRRITDKQEALEVLSDALANGDESMAHAIGTRARNNAWLDVAEAYQAAHPTTADSAAALAYVEANTSGAAYNLSNQITYSAPLTD